MLPVGRDGHVGKDQHPHDQERTGANRPAESHAGHQVLDHLRKDNTPDGGACDYETQGDPSLLLEVCLSLSGGQRLVLMVVRLFWNYLQQ